MPNRLPTSIVNRRDLMRWTAGATAGFGISGPAMAGTGDLLDILGRLLGQRAAPSQANQAHNEEQLDGTRILLAISALEQQADQKRLPLSSFTYQRTSPVADIEPSFYQSTLTRLVTLVDRGEMADANLADQAGEILAEVNASERVVPDALKAEPIILSRGHKFEALKDEYGALFSSVTMRSAYSDKIAWYVDVVTKSRDRYEKVANELKVPWYFIAAVHGLEASFNFRAHLHNGDFPLTQRTRQVPVGRPLVWLPPDDWASSAKDAIRLLGFANQSDWSLAHTLYRLEAFNGFGYRKQGVPTPYLWCFSNHYERGKFVSDGRWSATAQSHQCGSAVLLRALVDAKVIEFS